MPSDINIPALEGSIKPYLIAVKDYLLTEMTTRKWNPANWGKQRQHLVDIQTFVKTIDPNTITVKDLLDRLSDVGRNNPEDTIGYIDKIRNGLRNYLTQTNHYSNNNTLMLAARNQPNEVAPILEAMTHLNIDLRNTMLIQVTHDEGFSALMFAVRYNPEVVAPILRALSHNQDLLAFAILKSLGGQSALMIAARYQPNAVIPILNATTRLNPGQRAEMFHYYGDNTLMIAARYQPDAVTPIIEALTRLNPNLTVRLLGQVDHTEGDNALMLAVRYQPNALVPIIAAIKLINPNQQFTMFKQATRIEHYNALMIAAYYRPEAVAPILEAMTALNADRQVEVLTQVTMTFGDNALMLALMANNQLCVDSILSRINTFAPEQKKRILLTPNKAGKTALDLVTGHFNGELHPSRTSILAAIYSIDNPLPLEGDTPLMSSSSSSLPEASSSLASSSTAGSSGHVHHPDTISIENLLDRLSQGRNINETYIDPYITSIRNDLRGDLLQVDTHGNNILMLAARNHPNIVAPILTAMAQLNTDLQVVMLSQINTSDNLNALMLAARYQPDAVTPILDAITLLDPDILRQVNKADGLNALMIATYYQPHAVAPILKSMAQLNTDLQVAMLSQINTSDNLNALMQAARYQPDAVTPILDAITLLDPDILRQVSKTDGLNALMLAAGFHPEAVDSILLAMARLSPNLQVAILRQVSKTDGLNALMIAVHFHTEAVDSILTAMDRIGPDLQAEMLSQVTMNQGNNALMIALREKNHSSVDSILFRISTLSPEQKTQILLTPNKKGKTALDLVTGRINGELHPSYANILAAVDSIYNPLPLEGDAPLTSSSSSSLPEASSSTASSSSFFHHPDTSSSFAAELDQIEKITNVLAKDWTLSGKYLTVEVSRYQKEDLIRYLTTASNVELKAKSLTSGKTLISVKTSTLSSLEELTPEPKQYSGRPEDETFDGVSTTLQ